MADDNSNAKQLAARISALDEQSPSPEVRAQIVWEILQSKAPNLTDWDVVCFAVSYLGWQSQNFVWMADIAKRLNQLIYTAHYLSTNQDTTTGLKKNGRTDTLVNNPEPNKGAEQEINSSGLDVSGGGFG